MTTPHGEVTEVQRIPLDKIRLSPLNTRVVADSESFDSLVASIERSGLINPIKVRPVESGYEIVTGERRFSALIKANVPFAEAIVQEMTVEEVLQEQWDENQERQDLSDYEKALALKQRLDALGLTQEQLAEKVNLSRNRINQLLRMLQLEGKVTAVTLSKMTESQARPILAAPEEDWPALVQYVEVYFEEQGKASPASNLEDYALQLMSAREFDKNRRRFLYELEDEPIEDEPGAVSRDIAPVPEDERSYIEEHYLGWVFDAEANGNSAGFLTKLAQLTNEELTFCLANEARALNLQRLNDERDRRRALFSSAAKRSLLKQPPATSDQVIAFITEIIGTPAEDLQGKLMEAQGLSEEEAQAALHAFRETYPDIWERCYAEKVEEEEPEMTVEQYVADVLLHSPEVSHEELVRVAAEMFGVPEAYVQGLIDRNLGQKRGRKPRDPYAARIMCPLCGRQNAEKNRVLMVLEEYQATQPGVTLMDWLREVLL